MSRLPGLEREPTVTAVITAYNYAGFVGRAIDSVLEQDYPAQRLDLVVVDDGSTDDTPEVLDAYARRHPERVTVIHQPNGGMVNAANHGVSRATGRLVALLDADDVWSRDKVRLQAARLADDPQLGLVYCDQQIIDVQDRVLRPSRFAWLDIVRQRGSAFGAIMGSAGNIAVNSTIMFRAELIERIFPIPEQMPFQDWWIVAWASAVSAIDCVEGATVGYRFHGANDSLGGTGPRRLRATCMTAEARRQMLIHGGAELLDEAEVVAAWRAWEDSALYATGEATSAYIPLFPVSDEERFNASRYTEASRTAPDLAAALRAGVRALACDPFDAYAREHVRDLAWARETPALLEARAAAPPEAGPALRTAVVVARLSELRSTPTLLEGYLEVVSDHDDVTLAILADDRSGDPVAVMDEVARHAGRTLDELPDAALMDPDGAESRAARRGAIGALTDRWWEWHPVRPFRPHGFAAASAHSRLAARSPVAA